MPIKNIFTHAFYKLIEYFYKYRLRNHCNSIIVTMKPIVSILVCTAVLLSTTKAAKILGIFMVPSYSHQQVYQPIWRELSLRGHEVTVYTPDPLNDPTLTNLTEIDLSFSYSVFRNYSNNNFMKSSKIEETKNLFKAMISVFESQMSSQPLQDLLAKKNNESFDLFLVEFLFPPMYAFKDVFDCPMVGLTSLPLTTISVEALGMTKNPVFDPEFILPFSTDLSFRERFSSVILSWFLKLNYHLKIVPELHELTKKYFGPDAKDIKTLVREVSLVLGNFNYITQTIRPQVPAFVEIPGIHLKPEKPLPEDLKKFLDDSKEGVVYFSLGTNVKSSVLPQEKLDAILRAFAELPYKVLFKFESNDVKNLSLPDNVKIRKWIPQQDVLRHSNIKLFVTQGGLQSIDEALSAKVPMLVIPFFADQHYNSDKMVDSGIALSIEFSDMTKEELVEKINTLIRNPKYKKTAVELGGIAFDHQVPPLEKAVWWLEYVLRHKGAHHLRYKAVDLPFHQVNFLDVYCFLVVLCALIFYTVFKVGKKVITFSKFMYKSVSNADINSKKSQ